MTNTPKSYPSDALEEAKALRARVAELEAENQELRKAYGGLPSDICIKCGNRRDKHPYRHPFVNANMPKLKSRAALGDDQ